MPELRVLLLSDGRAGHYNLSEGIVAAMGRRRLIVIDRLEVHRRRFMPGRVAAGLLAAGLPPRTVLHLAHGLDDRRVSRADVIVSAGAETMPANVALARLWGVPNVFYGSLRAFRPSWFGLVLTSYATQVRDPHPVMTLKPSRLDPDSLPALDRKRGVHPPRRAGLLIGGDGGGTRFTRTDWDALLHVLTATHEAWGTRWIVANSRRTPGEVGDRLAKAASEGPAIERFIDVRSAGTGTLSDLLGASEIVAVTADSSSMLSEAVWSRRPVLALAPLANEMTPMEAAYRAWLEGAGRCRTLAIATATPALLLSVIGEIEPLPTNPQDDLAALLAEWLPAVCA